MHSKIRVLTSLIVIQLSTVLGAATLTPETKAAWDVYLQGANTAMHARLNPSSRFLWIDEQQNQAEHVRVKGPYIQPMSRAIPLKVSNGLIHDWIGVDFLPSATIRDVLNVVRAYEQYKIVYRPGVLESISRGSNGMQDWFFLRLANKSVVAKTALDIECESTCVRVDDRRWYSISNSIHIREVEKAGTAEARTLPEDVGTGLIWRLSSITRLEERDGGVYAELEALVLSRDIPAALRLFVTPLIRRLSKESLATSLRQSKTAINATIANPSTPINSMISPLSLPKLGGIFSSPARTHAKSSGKAASE